ncbi:MAG: DUF1298 domain-containing protein [Deltaproteobacteria bacterium]|nr:DUF1298 domain-containing protein [Deltaproteobacteria bacterium]MBW2394666.1 DUF1298 domain-containing protein [Deltaproteobacteria bacterium]
MHADYEHLSPREQGFLNLDRPDSPLHVMRVQLFPAAGLSDDSGGTAVDRIRERVAARIGDLHRYRRVLAELPLESRAIWVDAEDIDLDFHVRLVRLPRPGDGRQLKRLIGRIAATPLDPARPLWELWVIEGLENARVALVTKVHACLDEPEHYRGLPHALLTDEPSDKVGPPAHWRPHPPPSRIELAVDELQELAQLPADWWTRLRQWVAPEEGALGLSERVRAVGQAVASGLQIGSESPFDGEVGSLRRTDWTRMDAEAVDVVARRFGATVEEIALTVSTGALARFLEGTRGISLGGLDLRALVPLDPSADAARQGELAWILELPLAEADPARRLEEIRLRSRSEKAHEQARGAGLLAEFGAQVPGAIFSLATRVLRRRHPFSLVIATEHATSEPRYLLDALLEQTIPVEPVTHGLALSIALVYGPHGLSWGFNADWEAFPDLHDLVLATEQACAELVLAAGGGHSK